MKSPTKLLRLPADPAGDADLLRRYVAGRDEMAFAELVRRHGPLVRGVCLRMLGPADADDAAQAVFLTLARNAGRVRDADRLSGWLHSVSVRVCRKAWRRRASVGVEPRRPVADPADEASWREVAAAVDVALASLPDRLRLPLVLCYLDGLTRDEAAAQLGWSLDTFRGRLDRGRTKLRAALTRQGFGLPAGLLAVLLNSPRGEAAGWAAVVMRTIFDPAGPPAAVAALTVGVGWTMRAKVLFGMVTVLAAGGLAVSGRPLADPPKPEPVKSPAVAKPADPKPLGPTRIAMPKFSGVWTATDAPTASPGRRVIHLRILDEKHLLWTEQVVGTREFTLSQQLAYTIYDQGAGTELLQLERLPEPAVPASRPSQYSLTWGRTADGPVLYLTDLGGSRAASNRIRFVPTADPPTTGPDMRPVPPRKEPTYNGKPRYLHLAFGAKAESRVWAVAVGDRLYLDRDGDGDLTNDPDSPLTALPAGPMPTLPAGGAGDAGGIGENAPTRESRGYTFAAGKLAVASGRYADVQVHIASPDKAAPGDWVTMRVGVGGVWYELGTIVRPPGATPVAAPVLWFDRGGWVLRPAPNPDGYLARQPVELRAELTYSPSSDHPFGRVVRSTDDIPADKFPVARYGVIYEDRIQGGGPAIKLAERQASAFGSWTRFTGNLVLEDKPVLGPIQVALDFPNCPIGKVESFNYEVWIRRPPTPPVQTTPANRRNPFGKD